MDKMKMARAENIDKDSRLQDTPLYLQRISLEDDTVVSRSLWEKKKC